MIVQLEKDLASIVKAIEQAFANVNVLQGQKQGLEHAIKTIQAAANTTETVANAVEAVVDAPAAAAAPAAAPTTTEGAQT